MRIREATLDDRAAWDSFVDNEGGSFYHYFDWKYIHETIGNRFIPLLVEMAPSQLGGILPIVKENRPLSSILDSSGGGAVEGLLLKRELSDNERYEAISMLLEYVYENYSKGCSTFRLIENLTPAGILNDEPTAALIDNGFRFRYNRKTGLPCNYVLELKQPFEKTIWKGLWEHKLRQTLNKVEKSGVIVIQDQGLNYADDFIDMLFENYRRHETRLPIRDDIMARLNVFREKSKLFVALLHGQPIVALLCHYTPSTCYLSKIGSWVQDTDHASKLCYKVAIEDACDSGYRFVDFGYTETSSLAFFKERFKGTRFPVRIYEKRYSIPRTLIGTLMERTPVFIKNAWYEKRHIRNNRRKQ